MIRTVWAKLALVLAWTIAAVTLAYAPQPTAQALAGPELSVELTGLRVSGSGAKRTAVLSGKVTNTGAQPAFGVRVVLWRSRDPITDVNAFDAVLTGQSNPWGLLLYRTTDHYYRVTESAESFDPGASEEFTVRGRLSDLGFTTPGAVYVFGVNVLGTADASSNYQVVGQGRTFFVDQRRQRAPLTSIVLLAAAPTKVRPNVFASDALAAELTGRLSALVELAGRPGRSWLVDPALIDEVADIADGYDVLDAGETRPGTGQAAAQAWLERFRDLPPERGGRTLFGNPDLLGAELNGADDVLGHALDAEAGLADQEVVNDLADLPRVVLPHEGVASAALPAALADTETDAVLVSNANRGPLIGRGRGGIRLLRLTPGFDAAGPGEADGPVQRAQRQYAEAVLGGGLIRLIRTVEDGAAEESTTPRWLERTSLDDLIETRPERPNAVLTVPAQPVTLPAARFRALSALEDDFVRYRDLVPESVMAAGEAATLARTTSSAWIDDPSAGSWLAAVDDTVGAGAVDEGVGLVASPRVLMSSRTNEFPVTVINDLTEPIRVMVVFASDNPQRINIPDSAEITVGPGQSQTVNVRPEANSNGLVNVTATLETESGHPVGQSTRIAVEVTDLGMIGWIIVIVSGVVLVAATALRIRQVRRKQREEEL